MMNRISMLLLVGVCLLWGCGGDDAVQGLTEQNLAAFEVTLGPEETRAITSERWVTSKNEAVIIVDNDGAETQLTSDYPDMKTTWSPDGSMIVFMRVVDRQPLVADWKTKICVIRADGTGLRELTAGDYADYNPTWSRDGSNDIVFYRRKSATQINVYRTAYDLNIGEEEMISNPAYIETAPSTLSDGRIFVDRFTSESEQTSYLMTPVPGGDPIYEEITRPTDLVWHKLSVSPSETRVTYMLSYGDASDYRYSTLCVADFDVDTLTISNQREFTSYDTATIEEYPRWSFDESVIIFDSTLSGRYQAYIYRLSDGLIGRISPDENGSYGYSCGFEFVPK